MSIAKANTWEERLSDLGNIPMSRVRSEPMPGSASVEDVVRLRNTERRLYELVDGTLVEKAMGWQESVLAGVLLQWLNNYLDQHRIGVATGPDGMTRLFGAKKGHAQQKKGHAQYFASQSRCSLVLSSFMEPKATKAHSIPECNWAEH